MKIKHGPLMLSDMDKLHLGSKSDLLVSDALAVASVVLDGAATVQMLKPGIAKAFGEYAHKVFIPYVERQLCRVSRFNLVWDSYKDDSLKTATLEKR